MKALRCDFCGANLVMDPSREFATCEYCGTKYMKETIQQKIQEIRGEVKISGAVETFKGDAEKERLIKNAETYISIKEFDKAISTYDQIISQFPDDYRGWWGVFRSQIEKYFYTGTFNDLFPRALENTRKLCGDIQPIKQYFDDFAVRYGDNIRLVFAPSNLFFTFLGGELEIMTIDNLTSWLIYKSALYKDLFTDSFITFLKRLTNQFLIGIKNGRIIIPSNITLSPPPYCNETVGIDVSGYGQDQMKARIARFLGVQIVYLYANPANNHPIASHKLYYGNKAIEITEVSYIYGPWILVKGLQGEYIAILAQKELTTSQVYKWVYRCQHCGGQFEFSGFFKQSCSVCGKPKDY